MTDNKGITLREAVIKEAAERGVDEFVAVVADAIRSAVGGELTAESMMRLNAEQITLWGFVIMHEEVSDGGFIQLIHNGYGEFLFENPFAKAMRLWGLKDLSKLLYGVRELYVKHKDEICREHDDEGFMALFEKFPEFDDFDDLFIENEESYVNAVAYHIDEHLADFVTIVP